MNEAQTRATLIDPALRNAGWSCMTGDGDYWIPEVPVYPGRIDSQGEHRDPGFADYVLYCGREPVAVIEAKADKYEYDKGETQARYYAEALGIRFTYATNGQHVLEIDLETQETRTFKMSEFPTPIELAEMYGEDTRSELEKKCGAIPYSQAGGKSPRYYQERAVEAVIRKIGQGEKRALLTLATGTGKTFIAYQLVHKLVEAKWRNGKPLGVKPPTVLFIADRNILANQAQGDFSFPDHSCFRYLAESDRETADQGSKHVPLDRIVYFTIFQTLLGEKGDQEKYKQFPPDFFDLVIIDECHRGGRNDESEWRKILNYFSGAVHVGLTATPQCDVNGSTYAYFGEPAYVFSLKRGIAEGFLTQYRVAELSSTIRDYQVVDGDIIDYPDEVDPDKPYGNDQLERKRMIIDERDRHFVDVLFERMPLDQKAIVFCVTQGHARRIARLIAKAAKVRGITDPDYCAVVTADSGKLGNDALKRFQNNENTIPTILTTSQKLSTGVDAHNIRSIVLFRNVGSMVEFKQIVGRGTRTCKGKGYFTLYDFVGATEKFDDPGWDGDVVCPKCGQNPCVCTKGGGGGGGEEKLCPVCGFPMPSCVCPKPERHIIHIKLSASRTIESHWTDYVFIDDKRVPVDQFVSDFVAAVQGVVTDKEDLRSRWANPATRAEILVSLAEAGYPEDRLKDVQKIVERTDCDILDIMLDLVYAVPPITRAWRAEHLKDELAAMNPARRLFAETVLANYVDDGVWSLNRATLANYIKMRYGTVAEAMSSFGCDSVQDVTTFYDGLQERLYAEM